MKKTILLLILLMVVAFGVEQRYGDVIGSHFYHARNWTVGVPFPADSNSPSLHTILGLIDSLGGGVDSTILRTQYGILTTWHGDTVWVRLDTTTVDGRYLLKYAKNDSTKMSDSTKTIRGGIVDQQARDTAGAAYHRRDTLTAGWGILHKTHPVGQDTVSADSGAFDIWLHGFHDWQDSIARAKGDSGIKVGNVALDTGKAAFRMAERDSLLAIAASDTSKAALRKAERDSLLAITALDTAKAAHIKNLATVLSDTTIKIRGNKVDTSTVCTGNAATATKVAVRSCDTASTATPTPNCDLIDQYDLTALAAGATFGAPTGSPVNGQKLIIRILDNGGAQTLAWNSGAGGYISRGATLPTTTLLGKYLYVGLIYNSTSGKWECVAVSNEA